MITEWISPAIGNAPLFLIFGTAIVAVIAAVLLIKKDTH